MAVSCLSVVSARSCPPAEPPPKADDHEQMTATTTPPARRPPGSAAGGRPGAAPRPGGPAGARARAVVSANAVVSVWSRSSPTSSEERSWRPGLVPGAAPPCPPRGRGCGRSPAASSPSEWWSATASRCGRREPADPDQDPLGRSGSGSSGSGFWAAHPRSTARLTACDRVVPGGRSGRTSWRTPPARSPRPAPGSRPAPSPCRAAAGSAPGTAPRSPSPSDAGAREPRVRPVFHCPSLPTRRARHGWSRGRCPSDAAATRVPSPRLVPLSGTKSPRVSRRGPCRTAGACAR